MRVLFATTLMSFPLLACGGPPPARTIASSQASVVTTSAVFAPAHIEPVASATPTPEVDVIAQAEPVIATASFRARRGETLAHFARWSGLTVEDVAAYSGVELDTKLDVGDRIILPVAGDARAHVERNRDAHHQRRAEAYLNSRGGSVGTDFYVVRSGDNAWNVARDAMGVPVWLVETYNPSVDLSTIKPGQQLMFPIIADTVVSLDATPGADD